MPPRVKTSTTRLPQSLLEEIDGVEAQPHARQGRSFKYQVSRKEARKQEREGRKKKKSEYFSHSLSREKRAATDEILESPNRKKPRLGEIASSTGAKQKQKLVAQGEGNAHSKPATLKLPVTKPRTTHPKESLKKSGGQLAPLPKSQKELEEDSYITYLESKLGYSKDGKQKKVLEDDGLDDLLDLASSLAAPVDQNLDLGGDESDDISDEEYSESGGDEEYEEWTGISNVVESPEIPEPGPIEEKPTPGAAYVPPHLRRPQPDGKGAMTTTKLTKQLKGLLNRMGEQNMASIIESVEDAYRNHRRNDVTSTITTLILDGISSHSSLLDSYVVLHAAFISSLHKIIGVEFAAYFVQNLVSSYEHYYASLWDTAIPPENTGIEAVPGEDSAGKECSNLIVLLSELYNFQVISFILIFDFIRALLTHDLTEFNVELLLKIMRNSGLQLRQDDPSALKDIIQIVQSKISNKDDGLSSRTRFMIETLTNLKNNKLKRNATQNQGGDAVERMKKFLSGLTKKRHVMAHEPLRVSLDDLHSAETKGKWWLVGAAWGGDPLLDHQEATIERTAGLKSTDTNDDSLLKLARKQGMNTDIRRSIFVVLMSSDDYVDACDRLSQLSLTEVQQREIVRVLLHCCGNEKSYNPYYTLVCQHLCRSSHSYKITLQFCLWDFLRDLGETTVGGVELIKNLKDGDEDGFNVKSISSARLRNVANAYSWWIAKDCISLSVLKPVDFTSLKKQTREFLQEMIGQTCVNSQVSTPTIGPTPRSLSTLRDRGPIEQIFIKATRNQSLAMGLVYFLTDAFRDTRVEENHGALIRWAVGIAKETLRTGVDVVPTLM